MDGNKMCPNCGSLIQPMDRICRHCGWQQPVRSMASVRSANTQNCLAPQPKEPVIKGTLMQQKKEVPAAAQVPVWQDRPAEAVTPLTPPPVPVVPVTQTPPSVPVMQESPRQKRKTVSVLPVVLIVFVLAAAVLLLLPLTQCTAHKPGSEKTTSGETAAAETHPVQVEWSEWSDTVPDYVLAENYEIEERTLYSSRTLETASSTESDTMEGWELADTVEADGGYGPWSEWSETKIEPSATRKVQAQTRYRYRDKETTTGSSSAKDGWTLYDTTYSWGSYGGWSNWSTNAAYSSESRKVESKTQYRYRSISYTTEYTGWSSWSSWQVSAVSGTDLREVQTRTTYPYYYYLCPTCGHHDYYKGYKCKGGCGTTIPDNFVKVWSPVSWDDAGLVWVTSDKYRAIIDGQVVYKWSSQSPRTEYRYRTRSTQQVANYGGWSSWGDTAYSGSSTRQVETQKVYRYCDRSQIATYHFYRWGSWSGWSANQVTATTSREVETTEFYQYCDQIKTTTYYFQRWSAWGAFTEQVIEPSDTVQVETKIQYRYRSK